MKQNKRTPTENVAYIPVSFGELFDKITILDIKSERLQDPEKLKNVRRELEMLSRVRDGAVKDSPELQRLVKELKDANTVLWDLEEEIRVLQREGDLGGQFAKTADAIHRSNDRRMLAKRRINEFLGSGIVEEKSYHKT